MTKSIRIGVADDHCMVRQGLVSLLKEFEDMEIVFEAENGKEVLDLLKLNDEIDILLLDIEMPIMDGVEVFKKIRSKYPSLKVIVVTSHNEDRYIVEFLKSGAAGFLGKNNCIEKFMEAIRDVHENGFHYDASVSLIMAKAASNETNDVSIHRPDLNLTDQELTIIRLICLNKTNKDIAEKLFISVRTVEGHRLHIRQKTNCKTPIDLTTFSIRNNLLSIS